MPGNVEALVVVLLAIVPGFVTTTIWSRAKTWRGASSELRTVLESLALSVLVQLIVSPVTIAWLLPNRSDLIDEYPERLVGWLVLVVLVVPVVVGLASSKLSDYLADLQQVEPTGWRRVLAKSGPPLPRPRSGIGFSGRDHPMAAS